MKKDALITFLVCLSVTLVFSYLTANWIDTIAGGIADLDSSTLSLLTNIGTMGFFYPVVSIIFAFLTFISFFKML